MVTMKNIQCDGNIITLICYAEGHKDEKFTLVVDAHTFEILECPDREIDMYVTQARSRLYYLYEENQAFPEETSCVWY